MIKRLTIENRPVEYWGGKRSGNFRILIGECALPAVRIATVKELGSEETDNFLFSEMMKYYDKNWNGVSLEEEKKPGQLRKKW